MYEFKLRKHWKKPRTTDLNQTMMLRRTPQILRDSRVVVNRITKMRQTTCEWQRILSEERSNLDSKYLSATPALHILILSIAFIVFNKLTCKVRFEIAVRSTRKRSKSV